MLPNNLSGAEALSTQDPGISCFRPIKLGLTVHNLRCRACTHTPPLYAYPLASTRFTTEYKLIVRSLHKDGPVVAGD